jgi:hypothetical protein
MLGRKRLVDGDVVGVAVGDLPLALLAAVDVGDAQGVRRDRDAFDGYGGVFVADGVGQVALPPAAGRSE